MSGDAPLWLASVHVVLGLTTTIHALLKVRDPRAAWGWIAACLLAPIVGPLLYLLLGINRVDSSAPVIHEVVARTVPASLTARLPGVLAVELRELIRIGDAMTGRPLLDGNRIDVLHDGTHAWPAMLSAIDGAQRRVWLSSYIFSGHGIGARFVAALVAAQARGVEVRVLIDAVGDLYDFPRASRLLREAGVPTRRFQLARRRLWLPHLNLRNHRKLLIVDDGLAFTGGMNIREHSGLGSRGQAIVDLHFRLSGGIAGQLAEVFAHDWDGAVGGPDPLPPSASNAGISHCRVITEGPNEGIERLELVLLAALANAHRRVCIMTPYFIPMPELARGLESAALRGVAVELILPARSNLRWVDWASRRWQRELIARGVQVHLRPGPFAHSKLFVVDDYYTLVGSANLDPRSLRLNFELVVETYCPQLAATLLAHFDAVRAGCRRRTVADFAGTSIASRARDAACWLFSPYL
jgi:cardiolipin synthase